MKDNSDELLAWKWGQMRQRGAAAAAKAGRGGTSANDSPTTQLLNKFATTGKYAFIGQYGTAAPIVSLYHDIGSGIFIEYAPDITYTIGGSLGFIENVLKCRFLSNIKQDDAGLTYSSGWTKDLNSAGSYGAKYARTTTTNAYVQWTTPASATIHGWSLLGGTNAGICLVSVDGDNTKANLCPTAQDLVTLGTLAAGALVANGGTLNPTDRVWDQYATRTNEFGASLLADGLTEAAHTIRLTCTGYRNESSSDVRLYFSGFGYWSSALTPSATNIWLFREEELSICTSRWEFAYNYIPDGGSGYEFMGHADTLEISEAAKYYVDAVEVTPTTGTFVGGTEVKVVTANNIINHTEQANAGTADLEYAVTAAEGLKVTHEVTWTTAGNLIGSYSAMLPFYSTFMDKGSVVGATEDVVLNADDNSVNVNTQSQCGYLWQAAGNWGAALYIPNLELSVNNWADCDAKYMWIQDRDDGIEKLYVNRIDKSGASPKAVTVNDVYSGITHYRMRYFADGADTNLART